MANFLGKISEKYISIFSKVSVYRNLKGFKFNENLTLEDEVKIYNKVCSEFFKLYYSDRFKLESLDSVENVRKFTELTILPPSSRPYRVNSRFLSREDGFLFLGINGIEHIQITSKMQGVNYYRCGELAYFLEEDLEKNLDFSFNTEMGYLCQNIVFTGNGLYLEGLLHLPSLSYYGFNNVLIKKLMEAGIYLTSLRQFGFPFGDDFYLITCKNSFSDEFSMIRKMDKMVGEVVNLEIENRRKLLGIKTDYYRSKFEKYKKLISKEENLSEFVISKFISLALLLQSLELEVDYDYKTLTKNFVRLANLGNYKDSERQKVLAEITREILKG